MISPARRVAFDVLLRVETQAAYAGDLLHHASKGLESRDAGLASEIVFGTLRRLSQLDFVLAPHLKGRLDPEVRTALRMGAYQLRHLDRVPRHAAVSESVDLVKRAKKASAAPLVNAVLRKVQPGLVEFPSDELRYAMPAWLLDRWIKRWGREQAIAFAEAALEPPVTYVSETGRIQDIGAQWVVSLMDLKPGQRFLDVCAAPGNKTAQAMARGVKAVACDLHAHRLKALADLGCDRIALDATRPLPLKGKFDRILVDAPCSGTGTLARNPEIKWRLKAEDLADLHQRQVKILRNTLDLLAPGGVLLYATCSLEFEENESVMELVAGGGASHTYRLPGRDKGDGFFASTLPNPTTQ